MVRLAIQDTVAEMDKRLRQGILGTVGNKVYRVIAVHHTLVIVDTADTVVKMGQHRLRDGLAIVVIQVKVDTVAIQDILVLLDNRVYQVIQG